MVAAFDQRIIKVSIQLPDKLVTFQDLNISVVGRKFGTAIMNECECRIYNLTKSQKNYILTQASPQGVGPKLELKPIRVSVDVGRESYGTFRLFEGDVVSCLSSQPPDIGIALHSLTNNYFNAIIAGYTQPALSQLSQIAQMIANANNLQLIFQATDKKIDNYSFSGAVAKQVEKLEEFGVNAFIDDGKLIVLDIGKALQGDTRIISARTGMIGVPEVTQWGVRLKMMIDNTIILGGKVQVESEINPAANGVYYVTQINFEVSNRENPFWYILECRNPNNFAGGAA